MPGSAHVGRVRPIHAFVLLVLLAPVAAASDPVDVECEVSPSSMGCEVVRAPCHAMGDACATLAEPVVGVGATVIDAAKATPYCRPTESGTTCAFREGSMSDVGLLLRHRGDSLEASVEWIDCHEAGQC